MLSILSGFSRLLNTVKRTLCMTPFHVKSLLKDYNPSASLSVTLYIKKKKNHLDFYYIRHSDLLYLKLNSSYITESDIVMIHLWSIPWCVWLYPYDQCPGQGLTHGLKWIMGCFTVNWKEMLSFIDSVWTQEDAGVSFSVSSDPATKHGPTLKRP